MKVLYSILLFFISLGSFAQLEEDTKLGTYTHIIGKIYIGPKVGGHFYQGVFRKSNPILQDTALSLKSIPLPGYSAGLVFTYHVTRRFSFHTELYYSREGKKYTGGLLEKFRNRAVYHNIDAPFLFRMSFKRKVYYWYISAGPNFSYWLGGTGVIKSEELDEFFIDKNEYKVYFRKEDLGEEQNGKLVINMQEPNRIQLGSTFGIGAFFHTLRGQHLMVDIRYEIGHSYLGRDNGVDVGISEYFEDFRSSTRLLSLNLGYVLEIDLGAGMKGKTTIGKVNTKSNRKGKTEGKSTLSGKKKIFSKSQGKKKGNQGKSISGKRKKSSGRSVTRRKRGKN